MSLRGRPVSTTSTTTATIEESIISAPNLNNQEFQIQNTTTASPSLPQRCINQTLSSTANLANLLPTGTLLALQLLVPTFTNNGSCDSATHFMTQVLLLVLASSCFLASFTDSFKSPDGKVYYGMATFKGMWLFSYPMTESSLPDLSKYKLRIIDGIHGVLSVLTFVAVALRDANILKCFYPQPQHETQEILNIAPMGIGFMCGLLFVIFPTTRHGIGYPVSSKN